MIFSRSQWPCGLRRESSTAHLLGLQVRNPPGAWMSVFLQSGGYARNLPLYPNILMGMSHPKIMDNLGTFPRKVPPALIWIIIRSARESSAHVSDFLSM